MGMSDELASMLQPNSLQSDALLDGDNRISGNRKPHDCPFMAVPRYGRPSANRNKLAKFAMSFGVPKRRHLAMRV